MRFAGTVGRGAVYELQPPREYDYKSLLDARVDPAALDAPNAADRALPRPPAAFAALGESVDPETADFTDVPTLGARAVAALRAARRLRLVLCPGVTGGFLPHLPRLEALVVRESAGLPKFGKEVALAAATAGGGDGAGADDDGDGEVGEDSSYEYVS